MADQIKKSHHEDVCPSKKGKLDLDSARAHIAAVQGPEYWRSLEELAGSEDFQEMLHRACRQMPSAFASQAGIVD